MPKYPEIFVLRHGQTEWNVAGRHQGRQDSPLTPTGRAQATDQGQILHRIGRDWSKFQSYCSPQPRAVHTAQIALASLGHVARQDARLSEVSFGLWEGKTLAEIEAEFPEMDHEGDPFQWLFYAPGGESLEELSARARAFLDDLSEPSIIVTHGITSRVLRGLWLGQGPDEMRDMPGGQGNVHHLKNGSQTELRL